SHITRLPPTSPLFPYTTLFRSTVLGVEFAALLGNVVVIDTIFGIPGFGRLIYGSVLRLDLTMMQSLVLVFAVSVIIINLITDISDRKSTRLNSSHVKISYAVFC